MKEVPITTSAVTVDRVYNVSTEAYINNATVTMTLKDLSLNAVSGASNLSLTYVTGSNGKYQGTIPSTVTLTDGATYYLDITITSSTTIRTDRITCVADYLEGA